MTKLYWLLFLTLGVNLFAACGTTVRAEQPVKVETIQPSGYPGYTCFVFRNENGAAFAGNCVKD